MLLYKEFPFLKRYVDIDTIEEEPKVQRVDSGLLSQSAQHLLWDYDECIYESLESVRYILIDSNGAQLAEVKRARIVRPKRTFFKPSTWFALAYCIRGETVLEGVKKFDDPQCIKYILEIRHDHSAYRNGDPLITIHKVPNNPDWFATLLKQAEDELHSQLAEIDNV